MISFELKTQDDTKSLAEFVGKHIKEGTVIALIGDLGAGKTFFSKYLAKTLGAKEEVTSPTFNIMNIYEGICPIYHFDLYRLENLSQLEDIGFYEYTESEEGVCLIEWADKFKDELPETTVEVNFEILDKNLRKITFDGKGEIAEELMEILERGGLFLILALETSSKVSSVAVANGKELLAEITTESKLTHSKTLIPHTEKVLKLAGVEKKDLTKIAVSVGPGSFTGLRIGLAAAKAAAYALNIPIYGVPTLQSLAYHFPVPNLKIISVMDAQKNMLYRESYRFIDNNLQIIEKLDVLSFDAVTEEILNCGDNVMIAGEKAEKIFNGLNKDNVYLAPFYARMPRAALVAKYALDKKEPDNLMNLELLYVRRSEAEELWEKRHGKE